MIRRLAPLLALAAGCGVLSPEEQLLTRFFEASRLHDTTAVAALSRVTFNPRTAGVVDEFEVQDVVTAGEDVKQVTVAAQVRAWDGGVSARTLAVTMERVGGRWMIVALR